MILRKSAKQRISEELSQIGAAWALRDDKYISPDDEWGAKPTYHIHPDQSEPYSFRVKRFRSLKEIQMYIASVKTCMQVEDQGLKADIMEEYEAALESQRQGA